MIDCRSCKFFRNIEVDSVTDIGRCVRNPPVILESMIEESRDDDLWSWDRVEFATHFPVVWVDAVCGEWKKSKQ